MRAVGRLATTSVGPTTAAKQALFVSSSSFCSSSGGGGGGGGRGRGISSPFSSPAPGKAGAAGDDDDAPAETDRFSSPLGLGHGRGKPLPPPPVGNVFSHWMPSSPHVSAGRGRPQPSPSPMPPPDSAPKGPVFFRRFDDADSDSAPSTRGAGRGQTLRPPPETDTRTPPVVFHRGEADSKPAQSTDSVRAPRVGVLPQSILKGMHGAGRGKTLTPPETDTRSLEENRHIRQRGRQPGSPSAPRLSSEGRGGRGGRGGGRFEEGGRGRGGERRERDQEKRPRRRGRGRGGRKPEEEAQEEDFGLLVSGERFDENRLRQKLGEKNMSTLKEVVDEVCETVFPSEVYDGYLDALDTNFLVSQLCMIGRIMELTL